MRSRKYAKEIAGGLPRRTAVSLNPDLPNLLTGPDLLIGADRRTIAVFEPTKSEKAAPANLFARLALSRLALAPNTHCVLILPPKPESYGLSDLAVRHFHKVIVPDGASVNWKERVTSFQDAGPNYPGSIPDKIRRLVFARTTVLSDISDSSLDELGARAKLREVESNLVQLRGYTSTEPRKWMNGKASSRGLSFLRKEDSVFALSTDGEEKASIATLKQLCLIGIQLNYTLDDGVPYPVELTTNIFLTLNIRREIRDPFKAIRALAFAGWATLPPAEVSTLVSKVNDLRRRLAALGQAR